MDWWFIDGQVKCSVATTNQGPTSTMKINGQTGNTARSL
jgi:hypothetical protein